MINKNNYLKFKLERDEKVNIYIYIFLFNL